MEAGKFDRRITLESATFANDSAGDPIPTWSVAFKRWAKRDQFGGSQSEGADGILREHQVNFTVRDDSQSRTIAPENWRVVYEGRVYIITGIAEAKDERHALRVIQTATRPDLRGTVAPNG